MTSGVVVRSAPALLPTQIEELLRRVLGPTADEQLRTRLLRVLLQSAVQGAEQPAGVIGTPVTIGPDHPVLRRLATAHTPAIVGINTTTRERIRRGLLQVLADGGGLERQVDVVRQVFREASAVRAVTIARTEHAIFWHAGGRQQMLEAGVRAHMWITSRDHRVRATHKVADGQCREIGASFDVGGTKLAHPADPAGPPEEIINCFLPGTRVRGAFLAGIRSKYVGPARYIVTRSGQRLAVTANHPILTAQGLAPARTLRQGDDLLCDRAHVRAASTGVAHIHEQHAPALIEDVVEALGVAGTTSTHHLRPDDLHGDARHVIGKVDIVRAHCALRDDIESARQERRTELGFAPELVRGLRFPGAGTSTATLPMVHRSATGTPCPSEPALDAAGVLLQVLPLEALRIGCPPEWDAALAELAHEGDTDVPGLCGQAIQRHAGLIAHDEIVEVGDFEYRGHVYDLQSTSGLMIANNLLASNCRCTEIPLVGPCGSRSLSVEERAAIWKRAIRGIVAHERVVLREVRTIFRGQRASALTVLAEMTR